MKLKMLGALAALALLSACANQADTSGGTTGAGASNGVGGAGSGGGPGSQQDLVATAGDKVFFATAENNLSGEARGTLDRQVAFLGRYPQDQVQVAGNCDERGTEEYNIALGARRANAARDYLVAHGVASSRITTTSYGKDRPTALGSDEAAWAQNRNATTTVQ